MESIGDFAYVLKANRRKQQIFDCQGVDFFVSVNQNSRFCRECSFIPIGEILHGAGCFYFNVLNIGATIECIPRKGYETVRNGDGCQPCTVVKSIAANACYAVRNGNACQCRAVIECIASDGLQTVRQRDACQPCARGKSGHFNRGYAVGKCNACQI